MAIRKAASDAIRQCIAAVLRNANLDSSAYYNYTWSETHIAKMTPNGAEKLFRCENLCRDQERDRKDHL